MLQATWRSRDIPVTAEGIETDEQEIAARLCGCAQLQGYFLDKPMADIEIDKRLAPKWRAW